MKNILIVVDYQFDFADPQGALPVEGAAEIAANIQREINNPKYDCVIYTMDTHTPQDYEKSSEKDLFPNIHCEVGTPGWELYKITPRNPEISVQMKNDFFESGADMDFSKTCTNINDEFMFMKNQFDIWEGNKEYAKWFTEKFDKEIGIYIVGVATNYCVFMNAMGYPVRGYKNVNLIGDCIKGIEKFPDGSVDPSYSENIVAMLENGIRIIDPEEV